MAYILLLWSSAVTCRNCSPVAHTVYRMEMHSNPVKVCKARRPAAVPAPLKMFPHIQHSAGTLLQKEIQSRAQSMLCSGTGRYSKEGESGDAKVRGGSLREWDV